MSLYRGKSTNEADLVAGRYVGESEIVERLNKLEEIQNTYIRVNLGADKTIPAAKETVVPYDSIVKNIGNGLSYDLESHSIVVESPDIKRLFVSCGILEAWNNSNVKYIYVNVNNNKWANCCLAFSNLNLQTIIPVKQGDRIFITAYYNAAGNLSCITEYTYFMACAI